MIKRLLLCITLATLCLTANSQVLSRCVGKIELGEFINMELFSDNFNLPNIYKPQKGYDYSSYVARTKVDYFSVTWSEVSVDFEHTDNMVIAIQFSKVCKKEDYTDYNSLKSMFEKFYGKGMEEVSPGGQCLTCIWEDDKTAIEITHYMRSTSSSSELLLLFADKSTE